MRKHKDLIISIMKTIEKSESSYVSVNLGQKKYSQQIVTHTLELMEDRNLIKRDSRSEKQALDVQDDVSYKLTWDGYDYLDKHRGEYRANWLFYIVMSPLLIAFGLVLMGINAFIIYTFFTCSAKFLGWKWGGACPL
jgi:Hypothetical protein (DUF2513)